MRKQKGEAHPLVDYPLVDYPLVDYPLVDYPLVDYPSVDWIIPQYMQVIYAFAEGDTSRG